MPKFLYVGDDVRDFPSVPVTVTPGDVIEADTNPHPVYFTPVPSKAEVPADTVKE
jgi:hypothetical protein